MEKYGKCSHKKTNQTNTIRFHSYFRIIIFFPINECIVCVWVCSKLHTMALYVSNCMLRGYWLHARYAQRYDNNTETMEFVAHRKWLSRISRFIFNDRDVLRSDKHLDSMLSELQGAVTVHIIIYPNPIHQTLYSKLLISRIFFSQEIQYSNM